MLAKKQRAVARNALIGIDKSKLEPNSMQQSFVDNLHQLKTAGAKRALLISATGTGKTYASAFAMRAEKQKRVLFLVHREQIARSARESYRRVLGDQLSYGIVSGHEKDLDADYIFATVQTMAKSDIPAHFHQNDFQTIIIDEVHHAAASSYQRIIDHFRPQLLLGMTATPERTDGHDIYADFDHNIAYEIRLRQALEDHLLCPFHYFGITDLEIEGYLPDDKQDKRKLGPRDFQYLTSDARVQYIIEKAELYGYSGPRVKGVIFCSRKEIGKEVSKKMNARGKRTVFLSGDDDQERREECVERLVSDTIEQKKQLDYIITVDIFHEGVDIPEINQVIMIRPTQSPIIFIQQLGRGLRKAKDKEYVVIIDPIGNYANNYMIPIALSDDRSYNEDRMRRFVVSANRLLPGSSTIYMDEISRKRIYQAIDQARTNDNKMLKESYQMLKNKLGRIPEIDDFAKYGSIDIAKYFDKFGSYYHFLVKYEDDFEGTLLAAEEEVITFVSQKLTRGKRAEELLILKNIVEESSLSFRLEAYAQKLYQHLGRQEDRMALRSAIRHLMNQFAKSADQEKYQNCVFLKEEKNDVFSASDQFLDMLHGDLFKKEISQLIALGLNNYHQGHDHPYRKTNLCLNQKYTYEDVCLLLNWEKNIAAQTLGGYFYNKKTKQLPVFINYEKSDDAIAYEDRFISPEQLIALSRHPRKVSSPEADHFYKHTEADKDNHIDLFVRKNKDDDEAKEFYFLGEIAAQGDPLPVKMSFDITDEDGKIIGKKKDDAFGINYHLDVPVRDDIYECIVG